MTLDHPMCGKLVELMESAPRRDAVRRFIEELEGEDPLVVMAVLFKQASSYMLAFYTGCRTQRPRWECVYLASMLLSCAQSYMWASLNSYIGYFESRAGDDPVTEEEASELIRGFVGGDS